MVANEKELETLYVLQEKLREVREICRTDGKLGVEYHVCPDIANAVSAAADRVYRRIGRAEYDIDQKKKAELAAQREMQEAQEALEAAQEMPAEAAEV